MSLPAARARASTRDRGCHIARRTGRARLRDRRRARSPSSRTSNWAPAMPQLRRLRVEGFLRRRRRHLWRHAADHLRRRSRRPLPRAKTPVWRSSPLKPRTRRLRPRDPGSRRNAGPHRRVQRREPDRTRRGPSAMPASWRPMRKSFFRWAVATEERQRPTRILSNRHTAARQATTASGLRGRRSAGEAEMMGVNSRAELAVAEAVMQRRLRAHALDGGVGMIGARNVFICRMTRFSKPTCRSGLCGLRPRRHGERRRARSRRSRISKARKSAAVR